jgi:hypothetical protein
MKGCKLLELKNILLVILSIPNFLLNILLNLILFFSMWVSFYLFG